MLKLIQHLLMMPEKNLDILMLNDSTKSPDTSNPPKESAGGLLRESRTDMDKNWSRNPIHCRDTIIISRTDNLGDVLLTLPMAGVLKEYFPKSKIIFLGKKYTRPLIELSTSIDEFMDWEEIALKSTKEKIQEFKNKKADVIIHVFPHKEIAVLSKKAGIPVRIGTSHRIYHWFTCNKLLNFTRKNSDLHESQLNLKLLEPFGIKKIYSLSEISNYYHLKTPKVLRDDLKSYLDKNRFNLILHPKTKGSAREWGMDNFSGLIRILPQDNFKIFITGTKEEGETMRNFFSKHPQVTDLTGKLLLDELISFLSYTDGIVAASTGPLHIAAALGKYAFGIYAPIHPMHPGRWEPVGKHSCFFVVNKKCNRCKGTTHCPCIQSITPKEVSEKIISSLAVCKKERMN